MPKPSLTGYVLAFTTLTIRPDRQPRVRAYFLKLLFLIIMALFVLPASGVCLETISLKKYSTLSIPIPNPVEISKLPRGKTYQINQPHFVLQFFFSGLDIYGIIFKRENKFPIHLRWCFFRSCEENPYDYTVVIAPAYSPPFNGGFFSVSFPPQIKYKFQGLDFYSPR